MLWSLPSGISSIQLPSLSLSNPFKVNSEKVRGASFGINHDLTQTRQPFVGKAPHPGLPGRMHTKAELAPPHVHLHLGIRRVVAVDDLVVEVGLAARLVWEGERIDHYAPGLCRHHLVGRVLLEDEKAPRVRLPGAADKAPRDVNLAVRLKAEAESALLVLGLNASAAF